MILRLFIKMKLTLCVLWAFTLTSNAQNSPIQISGTVYDANTRESIPTAVIQVLPVDTLEDFNRNIGFATDADGKFRYSFSYKFPLKLRVTHISYEPKEMVLRNFTEAEGVRIYLEPKVFDSDELIVTADIISQEELESPTSVYKVGTVDVQQLASFDVFDLVSTVREVDVATQSMTMQSVNTRGFTSSANKRFLQLTDGVDNRAPGLNFPVGNLMGLIDLDIASVEIVPGPSSAKYGSSAINGVMTMTSRDPFMSEGLTIESKLGVTQFDFGGPTFFSAEGEGMYDMQARYAKALSSKIALKVAGSYMGGKDWPANNYDNIGFGSISDTHPDQPGYNGINTYGDEGFVFQNLYSGGDGFIYNGPPVTRTGYKEPDLVDYDVATARLAGSLHYKFDGENRIILDGRYGITNSLYTGDSRIRLEDFSMLQTSIELQLSRLNIKGYTTQQNSGDSYDVNSLANKLIQAAKPDQDWYRDYRIAFTRGLPFIGVPPNNHRDARRFADGGSTLLQGRNFSSRFEPGTEEFDANLERIKGSTDPDSGAAFVDNSGLYDIQATYEFPELVQNSVVTVGGNYRFLDLESQGTIFSDTTGNDITNYEAGFFVLAESSLLNDRLKMNTSFRVQKNENFSPRISPQIALNYNIDQKHYFKFSYQYGFRFPGVREQFINRDLGESRLLGGLPQLLSENELQGNAILQSSVDEYIGAVSEDNSITNRINNLSLLQDGIIGEGQLTGIKPEEVNTFDIGYRRLFNRNLFLDLNAYVSLYKNFIGITRVVKPLTSPSADLLVAAGQVGTTLENEKLYIYSNSEGQLIVQGASFNLEYNSGGFSSSLNGTFAKLLQNSDDPITPGFNTPPFKFNFEWGHRDLIPDVGFKMVYRYRAGYDWESSFIDGPVDAYGHFDFQFNVRLRNMKSMLKFGVSNLSYSGYSNIYGGPSIGSILFATYSYNPKMF